MISTIFYVVGAFFGEIENQNFDVSSTDDLHLMKHWENPYLLTVLSTLVISEYLSNKL